MCLSIALSDENSNEVKEALYQIRTNAFKNIAFKILIKKDEKAKKDSENIYTNLINKYTNRNISIINSFIDLINLSEK